jgi:choline dehydrogenase-like flavoprotein
MGEGDEAVLDEQMRVRGIDGLRIVDAAAMPDVISGNLNACVLMMAEKASDMILGREPLPAIHTRDPSQSPATQATIQ